MYHALAKFLEQSRVETDGFPLCIQKTKLRGFDRERISNVEVTPNGKPCAILLILFDPEFATEVSEHLRPLANELRQSTYFHVLAAM